MSDLRKAAEQALDALEYDTEPDAKYGIRTAITALREALAEPVVPEGWKLVPVEPTEEMLKAADDGDDVYTLRNFGPGVGRVMSGPYDHYVAMLAAVPQPKDTP